MKKFINIMLSLFIALSVVMPSSYQPAEAAADHVLITEVYYDTNLSYEPEEYIAITNPTGAAVDISGWVITNLGDSMSFPSRTSIAAGETMYITKDACRFKEQIVAITPNFEYGADCDANVPQMAGSVSAFSNTGDEVLLKNGNNVVDSVIYGSSTHSGSGWSGSPVADVSEGVILVRDRTESAGAWEDTDSAADFNDLRVYQAGQSRFPAPSFTFNGNVTAYTSPDSSYSELTDLMNNAVTSIDLNLYEFHNTYLLDTLLNAIGRGVKVRAFFEGQPVGGLTDQSKYVSKKIVDAGGQVRYIINNETEERFKRYRFDHAKYAIVDGMKVFLQSENWKSTGVPTTNTYGNRGWGIIIDNADFANYVKNVFDGDWNTGFRDSFPYTPGTAWGEPVSGFVPDAANPSGSYPVPFTNQTYTGTFTITPVFAPDSAFLKEKAIIGMIRGAQSELLVEQLYIHKHWGSSASGSPETDPNIYLEEVIDAGRRGVKVRVLLDSAFLDPNDSRDNQYTVDYINGIAANEGLDMEAKLADLSVLKLEKIHNKGMIADNKVLVSSINWSENSPTNNREAGVVVENTDVANYYKQVFWWDYTGGTSTQDPQGGSGEGTSGKLLLSEVYYDTAGDDNVEEYVEIYNGTGSTVDLSGYKLSDNAGTFTLPSGTSIAAGQRLVVARDTEGFKALFGFEPDVSGMTLALSNSGDQVILKDSTETELDFAAYEGYVSGWTLSASTGKVIYRADVATDSDTVNDWSVGNPSPKQ
ncbi:lamin tail domain-containing protein [Paenibacillus alkalitolerans]|uniref:lamin tail domain-containing protein n=1 Tax=Paenibacillus alkalitolerans TaxID=2799335 RepID=UPI0018F41C9E|nr:lamin tail domain-containing protein [Paenibacillus alkalitolerans]